MKKIQKNIDKGIQEFQPEFVIYNAGTDILKGDPLGGLSISAKGIVERDQIVFEKCIQNRIPIVMLMSGGYQYSNAEIIADSIKNLVQVFDLKNRDFS